MRRPQTKQAGFTLVEISLAMAIFTFMLLVVSLAYINIARLYSASTAARNVQQNNRFAMEQITRVARTSVNATITARSICFDRSGTVFYLRSVDPDDANRNELHQARVVSPGSCGSFNPAVPANITDDTILTSAGNFAARIAADNTVQGTLTLSIWMVSRTDLLNTVGDDLQCQQTSGSEFCAVNRLTTTVELRGNN